MPTQHETAWIYYCVVVHWDSKLRKATLLQKCKQNCSFQHIKSSASQHKKHFGLKISYGKKSFRTSTLFSLAWKLKWISWSRAAQKGWSWIVQKEKWKFVGWQPLVGTLEWAGGLGRAGQGGENGHPRFYGPYSVKRDNNILSTPSYTQIPLTISQANISPINF